MSLIRVLKNTYIIFFKALTRMVYHIFRLMNKQDNLKVIFVTSRGNKLEGNLKFVHNELMKQLPNAKVHFVHTKNRMNLSMFKEIKLLSNARYLIIDDYYLPVYLINPHKDLKVIQLWHAAGAFKKFGHSTKGTKFGPNSFYLKLVPIHSNYTYVYVSSGNVIEEYAEAFNMSPSHIFPCGIPRIDLFNQKQDCELIKSSIMKEYPVLAKKEAIRVLIAPTYRAGGNYGESASEFIKKLLKVKPRLRENIILIFKGHPYTSKKELGILKENSNVIIADNYSINEWMLVSDAFVTDYSSAIFEYALLERPLAHFVPDLREYNNNRGFYAKIDDISDGAILKSEKEFIEWLNNRSRNEYFNTTRMNAYNFDNTKNISSRIVNHFITK